MSEQAAARRRSAPDGRYSAGLDQRVARAAEAALDRNHVVSSIDVLVGLGWLAPSHVDAWRQGRVPNLETEIRGRSNPRAVARRHLISEHLIGPKARRGLSRETRPC